MEIDKIYNGDCLELMKLIPDNFIDITITSPPYNMRTRIRNNEYTKRENKKHFSKKYQHFSDDLPIDIFYLKHKKIIKELLRISKIIFYNFQIVTGSKEAFLKIIGDFNINIKDIIIWDKGTGQPAMHEKVLNSCYELILILENDCQKGRVINKAVFKRGEMSNILRLSNRKKITNIHNATFPESLPDTLIRNFSKENDIVFDPFCGSGTTCISALKNKRHYIGIDISKEYVELSEKLIENTKNELAYNLFFNI